MENQNLFGTNRADNLIGSDGADTLFGERGADNLSGGAGADSLIGGRGADTLFGGDGADSLFGENGTDSLLGENGDDTLTGGRGADTLFGGNGNDSLIDDRGLDYLDGGIGNDILTGGRRDDILTGGGDRDLFIINKGDGADTITDFGGIGRGTRPSQSILAEVDTIKFAGEGLTAQNLILTQEGSDLEISFAKTDNTRVTLQNFSLENLENLTRRTGASVDLGNIIFDDETTFEDSFDVINANQQIRTVFKRNGVTFLNGLDNNTQGFERSDDVINAQAGNDTLAGLSGKDILRGGKGNDRLIGGVGDDTLTGGGDRDRFVISLGDGNDTITDFGGIGRGVNPTEAIIAEVDTIEFNGAGLTAQNMLLTQNGDDLEISFIGIDNTSVVLENFNLKNLDNLTVPTRASVNSGNILFNGQTEMEDSFDVFNADEVRDTLYNQNSVTFLNDLDNNVKGFDTSNDVINAQNGNDTLAGLSGADILRGGAGNDLLIGGAGNDILTGNSGSDLFSFDSVSDGVDTIIDFNAAEGDLIAINSVGFDGIADPANFSFNAATGALLFGEAQIATLENVNTFDITSDIVLI